MRREAGFSLVELLVAFLLLSLALLAAVPMFVIADHAVVSGRDRTVAVLLVEAKVEALRSGPHADLVTGTYSDSVVVGGTPFTRTWVVVEDSPHPGLTTVTVTAEAERRARPLAPRSRASVRFYDAS